MRFFRRPVARPSRLGILPGTFNPVTVAHVALGQAALAHVDEVLFTLPRAFPHKQFTGATFEDRILMLETALHPYSACSIAATEGGLFAEIADECREAYGSEVRLSFLCGRDAAERIVGWDYGSPGAIGEMLTRFGLLVADRNGEYRPPEEFRGAIQPLLLPAACDHVSATEVRDRIARGEPWEHLVPKDIRQHVKRIFGPRPGY